MTTLMKAILAAALSALCLPALAAGTNNNDSNATSTSGASSNSGAAAFVGAGGAASNTNIFQASEIPDDTTQTIKNVPNVYAPPSMFGGANNCGQSSSLAAGVAGFGIGGSIASSSEACNAREDTSIAYKLGFRDVANMRFFCFGESANRMAYEATGHVCPAGATAKGLPQAPVRKVAASAAAPQEKGATDMSSCGETHGYSGDDPIVLKRLGCAS